MTCDLEQRAGWVSRENTAVAWLLQNGVSKASTATVKTPSEVESLEGSSKQ